MISSAATQACYVCVNANCRGGGATEILRKLTEQLAGTAVQVREQVCFGACWTGPNVVLYPTGTWYCSVGAADVEDIVRHIAGGPPVERLIEIGRAHV